MTVETVRSFQGDTITISEVQADRRWWDVDCRACGWPVATELGSLADAAAVATDHVLRCEPY